MRLLILMMGGQNGWFSHSKSVLCPEIVPCKAQEYQSMCYSRWVLTCHVGFPIAVSPRPHPTGKLVWNSQSLLNKKVSGRSHRKPGIQLTALKPVLTVLSIFPSLDLLIATLDWQRQTTCGFLIDSSMSGGNPIGYSESSKIWKASELVKKNGIWLCVSVFYYWVHHMICYSCLLHILLSQPSPKSQT